MRERTIQTTITCDNGYLVGYSVKDAYHALYDVYKHFSRMYDNPANMTELMKASRVLTALRNHEYSIIEDGHCIHFVDDIF